MGRVQNITREVRMHDECLYAQETKPGRIDLYRKNRNGMEPPHYLMSLTDNWQATGRPVDWGVEPILSRLRAMDLWRDDNFVERFVADSEKEDASRERARKNSVESFLYDFRSQFAKATNEINTSTLERVKRKD